MVDNKREAEAVYIRPSDGKWTPGRFPDGVYEQMQSYADGGGWALVNEKRAEKASPSV